MKSILTPRAQPSLRWHWRLISHANSLTNRSARQTSKNAFRFGAGLLGLHQQGVIYTCPRPGRAGVLARRIVGCEFGFGILENPARYPSGPRERSAKPPFVGSNPTRASKSFRSGPET